MAFAQSIKVYRNMAVRVIARFPVTGTVTVLPRLNYYNHYNQVLSNV